MYLKRVCILFCILIVWIQAMATNSLPALKDSTSLKERGKSSVRAANSQPLFDLQSKLINYAPASPEASAMIGRIKQPVNYSIGSLDIAIPLHEIKTRDFVLPISLRCNTSGIKAHEQSGSVGLGWTLQAEPSIQREVKGKRDEGNNGYLNYNRQFGSSDVLYLKDLSEGVIDEQPDIFYFSTLTNSGQFVFKRPESAAESGRYRPILIPASPEKITINGLGYLPIQIKDDKGNLCFYGDNANYTEYSSSGTNYSISCWKASKIISPNKDSVSFTYVKGSDFIMPANYDYYAVEDEDPGYQEYEEIIPCSGGYWKGVDGNLDYYDGVEFYNDTEQQKTYISNFEKEPYIRDFTYEEGNSFVSSKKLKEITFTNGKVVFTYGSGGLSNMQIFEKNILIKEIKFSYTPINNTTSGRYSLDKVEITDKISNGTQTYVLDYYNSTPYSRQTKGIDFWGYYNGHEENWDLVPMQEIEMSHRISADNIYYAWIGGANREPVLEYAQAYTLRSITYPTGNRDNFNYGLNKYKDPETGEIKEAGGLRIESVQTFDRTAQLTDARFFEYGLNGDESGVIRVSPDLAFFRSEHQRIYVILFGQHTRRYRVFSSRSAANLFFSAGSPVLYSHIVETRGLNEQRVKTEYYFNNDTYTSPYPDYIYPDYVNNWRFQKLLNQKEYIGTDSTLLKEVENTYTTLAARNDNSDRAEAREIYTQNIVSFIGTPEVFTYYSYLENTYGLYGFQNYAISEKKETDYSGNAPLTSTTNYIYGQAGWDALTGKPISVSTTNSDGTKSIVSYKYPYHYVSGNPEYTIAQQMIQNNDVSKIFEESYSLYTADNVQKKLKYNYGATPGQLVPYKLNSLQVSLASPSVLKDVERYTRYDERGNLLEYIRKDGQTVTLLWGYDYQLLIAEIEGSDYASVSSKIASYVQLQTQDGTTLQTTLNGVRTGLPNALVTTYSYYPTRGMATKTDPAGRTTTYEYSGKGELLKTKDATGKLIESYEYKYNK